MLSEREILEKAQGILEARGIYFLISDGVIVYIGESNSVYNRIAEHLKDSKLKKFDSYTIELMNDSTKKERKSMEEMYISLHNPKYNKKNVVMNRDMEKLFCREVKAKFVDRIRE